MSQTEQSPQIYCVTCLALGQQTLATTEREGDPLCEDCAKHRDDTIESDSDTSSS